MMSSKLIFMLQGAGHLAPLGTAWHICANFATCSWEPLIMLNPHFVAWEHGLFGGHESEDIWTIFQYRPNYSYQKRQSYFTKYIVWIQHSILYYSILQMCASMYYKYSE